MSQFLPETPQSAVQQTDFKPVVETPTLDGDIALMQRIFSAAVANPSQIPSDFLAYMVDFIQTQRLNIPIGQVIGFSGFTPKVAAPLNTQGTITSSTPGDCTDGVGPSLTGLPDGQYLLLFGGGCSAPTAGHSANIGFSANGGAVDTNNVAWTHTTDLVATARAAIVTLNSGGGNSVVLKYFSGIGTDTTMYALRWLVAIKYANL